MSHLVSVGASAEWVVGPSQKQLLHQNPQHTKVTGNHKNRRLLTNQMDAQYQSPFSIIPKTPSATAHHQVGAGRGHGSEGLAVDFIHFTVSLPVAKDRSQLWAYCHGLEGLESFRMVLPRVRVMDQQCQSHLELVRMQILGVSNS